MKKIGIPLLFACMLVLTGCPDSERVYEEAVQTAVFPAGGANKETSTQAPDPGGQAPAPDVPDEPFDWSGIFQIESAGTYAHLASEDTILMALTQSPDKPDWTKEMTMRQAADKQGNVKEKAGFGRLGDGTYAVSLPYPATQDWYLHISAGQEIGGVFREGVLLNANNVPTPIQSASYSFEFNGTLREKSGVKATAASGSYGCIKFERNGDSYQNMWHFGYDLIFRSQFNFHNNYSSSEQYLFVLKRDNVPVDSFGNLRTSE